MAVQGLNIFQDMNMWHITKYDKINFHKNYKHKLSDVNLEDLCHHRTFQRNDADNGWSPL